MMVIWMGVRFLLLIIPGTLTLLWVVVDIRDSRKSSFPLRGWWKERWCFSPSKFNEWMKSLSCVRLFVIPWTVAYQAPPSMGFFQARILEWVAISFSRRSSWPRHWTWVSLIVGRHFTIWTTRLTNIFAFKTQSSSNKKAETWLILIENI